MSRIMLLRVYCMVGATSYLTQYLFVVIPGQVRILEPDLSPTYGDELHTKEFEWPRKIVIEMRHANT